MAAVGGMLAAVGGMMAHDGAVRVVFGFVRVSSGGVRVVFGSVVNRILSFPLSDMEVLIKFFNFLKCRVRYTVYTYINTQK